jgi:hypothetical protein
MRRGFASGAKGKSSKIILPYFPVFHFPVGKTPDRKMEDRKIWKDDF